MIDVLYPPNTNMVCSLIVKPTNIMTDKRKNKNKLTIILLGGACSFRHFTSCACWF